MSGINLSNELKDVDPVPSPDEPVADPAPEPVKVEDKDGKGKDRTPDEIRGELLRKQEKAMADLKQEQQDFMGSILDKFNDIAGKLSQPSPQQPGVQKKIEEYTADELKTFRGKVPEGESAELEFRIQLAEQEERLEKKFQVQTNQQRLRDDRDKFNAMAVERYPDLKKKGSDFARAVQRHLDSIDSQLVTNHPRSILDAANAVAIESGVSPKRRVLSMQKPVAGNTGPADAPVDASEPSDEELTAEARRLSRALPEGQKFDLDYIKQRRKEIKKEINIHEKG
jgi:hypothetical protein